MHFGRTVEYCNFILARQQHEKILTNGSAPHVPIIIC